jgi:hypothetical protein
MNTQLRTPTRLRRIGWLLVALAAFAAVTVSWLAYGRAAAQPETMPVVEPPRAGGLRPSAAFTLNLPAVYHTLALQQPLFGVQMNQIANTSGLTRVVAAQSNWVRAGGVNWASVEASQGVYNWGALGSNAAQWQTASANGLRVILVVGGTPGWAQEHPGVSCGAIRPDKLAAFGNFMHELVKRYSVPPYNLQYFEIWNEPDVDPAAVPGNSTFGCWGDPDDDYYGGGYFGQMLQTIYPRIKAANPNAQVAVGGLLLDCDPNNPPAGKDCKSSKFFEGILRQGGGAYFDGVGVHGYDAYGGTLGTYNSPNWGTSSTNTTGFTTGLEAKVHYVRGLMAAYGVTGKFVMNNESAVGRFAASTSPDYESTKAYYVAQIYATAAAEHLLANIWYALDDDWHHQALLNPDLSPRQAYFAYLRSAVELKYARYLNPLTGYAGVKGFVFDVQGHDLWLLWSQDGAVHALTLPGTPVAIRDVDGTAKTVTGNQLSIGPEPLYVEWAP